MEKKTNWKKTLSDRLLECWKLISWNLTLRTKTRTKSKSSFDRLKSENWKKRLKKDSKTSRRLGKKTSCLFYSTWASFKMCFINHRITNVLCVGEQPWFIGKEYDSQLRGREFETRLGNKLFHAIFGSKSIGQKWDL